MTDSHSSCFFLSFFLFTLHFSFVAYRPTSLERNYEHPLMVSRDVGVNVDMLREQDFADFDREYLFFLPVSAIGAFHSLWRLWIQRLTMSLYLAILFSRYVYSTLPSASLVSTAPTLEQALDAMHPDDRALMVDDISDKPENKRCEPLFAYFAIC